VILFNDLSQNPSPENQRRAVAIAREVGFQTIDEDTGYIEWEAVLHAVFGAGSGYEMLHRQITQMALIIPRRTFR
jgi:hypothetical protein